MRLNGWSKGRAVAWTLRSPWVPLPPASSASPNILFHFPSCCLSTSGPSFNLQLCLSLCTVLNVGGLPSLHTVRSDCRVIEKSRNRRDNKVMGSRVYLPFVGVVLCVSVFFCVCFCAFTTDGCWLMAIFVFLLCIYCSVCMYSILSIC